LFDTKTKSNLILWPVEEVESLRTINKNFNSIPLYPGSTYQLDVGEATQVAQLQYSEHKSTQKTGDSQIEFELLTFFFFFFLRSSWT